MTRSLMLIALAFSILFLGGCSATQPPTEALTAAETAIEEADNATASQHAPLELHKAREKLEEAEKAARQEQYLRARRLAEKARADADLAEAKSRATRMQKNAEEASETLESLRSEAQRN